MPASYTRSFLADATANALLDADAGLQANGTVEVYGGGTVASPTTLIGTFNLGATPYATATSKRANFNALLTATAVANGTPAIYQLKRSGGTLHSAGTITGATALVIGQQFTLDDFDITHP